MTEQDIAKSVDCQSLIMAKAEWLRDKMVMICPMINHTRNTGKVLFAQIAQLVEQMFCKHPVKCSSHFLGYS